MNRVNLGKTGIKVSSMSLGCMHMGSTISKEDSYRLLDTYVSNGGNFLDTANCYSWWIDGSFGGESERVLGDWIEERGNRKDIFLATKIGQNTFDKEAAEKDYINNIEGLSESAILSAVDRCLKNLKTDYIDLLYIHVDLRINPLKETMGALNKVVESGKVRYIGASNMKPWRMEEARNICQKYGWAEFSCIQQAYTFLHPRPGADFGVYECTDDNLLDYITERGISLLAYSPLMGGYYTRPEKRESYWKKECYDNAGNESRLETLDRIAKELNITQNQLIFAWMMQKKIPAIPLIAASKVEHLIENIESENVILTNEQIELLNKC